MPWSTIASVLVAARLCEPSSELHIAEDWFRRTALDDLLGVSEAKVNDDRCYRALDRVLTQSFLGAVIFAVVMVLMFVIVMMRVRAGLARLAPKRNRANGHHEDKRHAAGHHLGQRLALDHLERLFPSRSRALCGRFVLKRMERHFRFLLLLAMALEAVFANQRNHVGLERVGLAGRRSVGALRTRLARFRLLGVSALGSSVLGGGLFVGRRLRGCRANSRSDRQNDDHCTDD